jgi:hypothetical protein
MKASMKSVMKNSMNKIMKESDLESKNFLPKILCGAKNIGVCGSKKKTKNDRFVVTATLNQIFATEIFVTVFTKIIFQFFNFLKSKFSFSSIFGTRVLGFMHIKVVRK